MGIGIGGIATGRLLIGGIGVGIALLEMLQIGACLTGAVVGDEVLQARTHRVDKDGCHKRVLVDGRDGDDARFLVYATTYGAVYAL